MTRHDIIRKLEYVAGDNEVYINPISLHKGMKLNKWVSCRATIMLDCLAFKFSYRHVVLNLNAVSYDYNDVVFNTIELCECPLRILKQVIQNIPSHPELKIWYDLNEHQ